MEIISLLIFVIGILGSVAVEQKGNAPSSTAGPRTHELDIANPNTSIFKLDESTTDGVKTIKISPKDDSNKATKVLESSSLIWEAAEGETSHMVTVYYDGQKPVSATVRFKNSEGKTYDRPFNKKDDKWERVNLEDQQEVLIKLGGGVKSIAVQQQGRPQSSQPTGPITLDLENPNFSLFDVKELEENGVTKSVYTSKTPQMFRAVVEGGLELWKSDSNTKYCTSATIYFDEDDDPILAHFYIKSDNDNLVARRQKTDGSWTPVNKAVFDATLETIKLGTTASTLKDIELDIKDIDTNVFTVEESTEGQASCKKCIPRPGNNLTEIFELNVPIWDGKMEESCEEVILYSLQNTPLLAVLQINKDTGRSISRHQKKDGRWIVVNEQDFNTVLTDMREGKAEVPTGTTDAPKPQTTQAKTVTLNINTNQPSQNFKAFDFYMDDVLTRMFTFAEGYNPVKIVDGNQKVLWRALSGEKCRYILVHAPDKSYTFAHIFITTTIIVDDLFAHYDDGEWKMSSDKYREKLKAAKGKTKLIANFRMDINQRVSTAQCKVISTDFEGVPVIMLIPTKGYHAITVHFGSQILWQATNNGERCTFVVLRIIDNENVLLSLTIRKHDSKFLSTSENKFLSLVIIKNGDIWSYIDSKTYFSNLVSLDVNKKLKQALTLDINLVPHGSKCKYETSAAKRFRSLTYYPCTDIYTNALVDGPCPLWSTNAHGERCVESQVHYNHGSYALCKFTITNVENRSTAYYFMKEEGVWKKTGIDEFYQKLSEMGSNVPEPYSLKVDENLGDNACGFCNFECDTLHTSLHVPSSQRFVDTVLYDSHPFWASGAIDVGCVMAVVDYKDRLPLLARLRLSNYHDGDNVYFGMKNGRWEPISPQVYDQNRESIEMDLVKGKTPHGENCLSLLPESKDLKRALPSRASKFVTLDITDVSAQYCTMIKCELDDVLTSLFFMNPEQPIGSIKDGPIDIWRSESESECIFASVAHNVDHDNRLIYLIIRSLDDSVGVECYMKDLNVWLSVDKSVYDEHINNLRLKTPFKAMFTIDITSKEDNIMCRSTSVLLDDLPTSLFVPHSGYHATKVVDGAHNVIWQGEGKDRCIYLSTRYKGGNPFLLYLGITSEDDRDAKHYIKQDDGTWKLVDKKDYDKMLANLKAANIQFNTVKYRLIGLDIKSPAPYDFDVKKDDGPNSTIMITPKPGIKMIKVYEGDLEIWDTTSQGVHCMKISVNLLNSKPTMASLFITDASGNTVLYVYTKNNDVWEFAQSADYSSSYRAYTSAVLDISNYDKKLDLEVDTFMFDGKKYTKYAPFSSSNLRIMTVVDGNQTIWDSSSGEECCADVTVFSDQTGYLYCHLTVLFSEKGTTVRCFAMNSGKWCSKSAYESRAPITQLLQKISSLRVTLDISSGSNEYFKVVSFDLDDVPTRLYYPLGNFVVEKVVDGNATTLWQHSDGKPFMYLIAHYSGNVCVLINIVYEVKIPVSHTYHHRQQDGKWKSVNKTTYDTQLISLSTKPSQPSQKSKSTFTLDITVVLDTDECKVISCELHGISTYFYIPKSGYHANKVVEYGLDSWNASGNERCVFLTVYLKNGVFSLMDVVKLNGTKYESVYWKRKFLRDDDPVCEKSKIKSLNMHRWKSVTTSTRHGPNYRFSKIKESTSTLNIDTVTDDKHFYTEDRYARGTHMIRHTSRFGKSITQVRHAELSIWKEDNSGLRCIDAFVYVERGSNKLLYLLLWKPADGHFCIVHYRRKNHLTWVKTTRRKYTESLDSLMYNSFRYGFSMDVSTKTSSHNCEVVECHVQDVPACFHAPRAKFQLNSITDGDSIIWRRRCDKRVVFATVYFQNGKPYLCDIIMKNFSWDVENVCFKKDLYGWTIVTKQDYVSKLSLIKFKVPHIETIPVDISHVPEGKCRQIDMTVDNSLVQIFMPLPGYRVNKITDGQSVLSTPKEGQVFSFYAKSDDTECVVGKHIPSRASGSKQLEKSGTEWPNIAHQNLSWYQSKYFNPKVLDNTMKIQ